MARAEYAKTPHKKLPISRGRYQLIPVLSDLFAKKSFSGHKLDQTLKENHFTDEDRALFTELFYGFLRYGHQLLFFVDKFLSQPEKMPEKAKWILAIAFYQKLYLSKIPDHAIVNEAVEMTKRFVGEEGPFPGVVNAVLKKFLRHIALFQKMDNYPLWVQTSFPEWLAEHFIEQWTTIKFFQLAQALNTVSPTFIRVNATKISEEKLLIKLKDDGIHCTQTGVSNCLKLSHLTMSPKDIPGYHEGLWTIQNMASQRVVKLFDFREDDHVLDACAGFGGKTLQMAEIMRDKIHVDFYDIVEKKMHAVQIRAQQMGFRHVRPVTEFQQKYHKILVDAPCSGLGTISSHPEIKWFRTAEDLKDQQVKQIEVMNQYSQHLLPEGRLLYAVCSIDKNEGEGIINKFLEEHKDFILDPEFKTPFHDVECGTYLFPNDKGESGYFISRLVKVSS